MIEFGGVIYFIDLDTLDKVLTPKGYKPNDEIKHETTKSYYDSNGNITGYEVSIEKMARGKEIDAPKYEIFKYMIEILLDPTSDSEEDVSLGSERALSKKPLSYQLAFNTLFEYGILKEKL